MTERTSRDRAAPPSYDADRRAIWEILVAHDIEAFLAQDWSLMADDFWPEAFCGIQAHAALDPARWSLAFPTLDLYRAEWTRQSAAFAPVELRDISKSDFLYQAMSLPEIQVVGAGAMARKTLAGEAQSTDGESIRLGFQSVFFLAQRGGRWQISGFLGYLPYPIASEKLGALWT